MQIISWLVAFVPLAFQILLSCSRGLRRVSRTLFAGPSQLPSNRERFVCREVFRADKPATSFGSSGQSSTFNNCGHAADVDAEAFGDLRDC